MKFPLILVVTFFTLCPCVLAVFCTKGYYLYIPKFGRDICLKCPLGTYMPIPLHTETDCYSCNEIVRPDRETVISDCNSTHDIQIGCKQRYFRVASTAPHEPGDCVPCTKCPFPGRLCQANADTICCLGPGYSIQDDKDGIPKCMLYCGKGEYLETSAEEVCRPCPKNTFMDQQRHRNRICMDCPKAETGYEIVVHECNSTHPTVFTCRQGYFKDKSYSGSDYLPRCTICQICSYHSTKHYKGRDCDAEHDTVCCQKSQMIVVETPIGFQCVVNQTVVVTLPPEKKNNTVDNSTDSANQTPMEPTREVIRSSSKFTTNISGVVAAGVSIGVISFSPLLLIALAIWADWKKGDNSDTVGHFKDFQDSSYFRSRY